MATSTIRLGNTPGQLIVDLTSGNDFNATIRTSDGSTWAAGTQVSLVFSNPTATWTATVAGDTLVWSVDKALVTPIVASAGTTKVHLKYVLGAIDLGWASGQVVKHV